MKAPSAIRKFAKGKLFRISIATLFTAFIGVLIYQSVSWPLIVEILGYLDVTLALAALLIYTGVTAIRARRFVVAGAKLSFDSAFYIAAVHAALLRVMPLRSGELAYGVLLKKKGGGSFTEGIAALLMLRVLDIAAIAPLAAVAVGVFLTHSSAVVAALGVVGLAFGVAFFFAKPIFLRIETVLVQRGREGVEAKLIPLVRQMVEAYDLPAKQRMSLLALTLVMWVLLIAWMCTLLLAIGAVPAVRLGIGSAILGIVGSILPVSLVGSFGPMEGGLAMGLAALGQSRELALSGALVVSVLTFLCNWFVGIPSWLAFLFTEEKSTKGTSESIGERIKRVGSKSLGMLLFAGVGGALLLFRLPYGFETNDQFQYLLLPYRHIYEGFLTGDWFTWETTHYHVAFSWLIRGVHGIFGDEGFPYAIFSIHVVVLTALAFALLKMARATGFGWFSASFALITVGFVRHLGIGGALVNHGILLPADMALPPLLIGVAFWIEKRPFLGGLFLGLAGLLHANFAVLAPLVVAGPELIDMIKLRRIRPTVRLAAGYLLFAWPTLLVSLLAFFTSDPSPGALDVLFKVRSPHHYNPTFGDATSLAWLTVLAVGGLPVWLTPSHAKLNRLRGIVLVLLTLQVIAYVATAMDMGLIIRLFFWRLSVPLMLIGALAVGHTVACAVSEGRLAMMVYAGAAIVMVFSFAANGQVRTEPSFVLAGYGQLLYALLPLLLAALMMRFQEGVLVRIAGGLLAAVALAWCVGISIPGTVKLDKPGINWDVAKKKWGTFTVLNESRITGEEQVWGIHEWIREKTPNDATFLIPPGQGHFRLAARRGVFVDWKCCPMKGSEVLEWKRRMLATMGTKTFPANGYALHRVSNQRYNRRSLKTLADLARRENITHIMTSLNRPSRVVSAAGLKKLVRKSGFTVYQVE